MCIVLSILPPIRKLSKTYTAKNITVYSQSFKDLKIDFLSASTVFYLGLRGVRFQKQKWNQQKWWSVKTLVRLDTSMHRSKLIKQMCHTIIIHLEDASSKTRQINFAPQSSQHENTPKPLPDTTQQHLPPRILQYRVAVTALHTYTHTRIPCCRHRPLDTTTNM